MSPRPDISDMDLHAFIDDELDVECRAAADRGEQQLDKGELDAVAGAERQRRAA